MAYPLVAAGRNPLPPGTTVEYFTRNLTYQFLGAWWLQAVIPSPRDHGGAGGCRPYSFLRRDHSGAGTEKFMIFICFFPSTILFKNAFLGLDLAGKPFGCDFEQLSPCKMKKMFPIARLAMVSQWRIHWWLQAVTPCPQGPQWSILPRT